MAKLLTGNMARASLPHEQDEVKAADKFAGFTADTLDMIVTAFTMADGVEAELIAKVAFGVISQRMASLFNPALDKSGLDAKRLKVAAIAAMAMSRQVFKNFPDTAEGMSHEDAIEWVAAKYAAGYRFLNRIEARWRMGAKVAGEAYKIRAVVVQCLQAKSQQAGLVAFIDATRDIVARVMGEMKAAAKAAKSQPAIVDKVRKYLDNQALNSADLAALIGHLNTLHAQAVNLETAAAARDVDTDEEDEYSEAA
jgi:hypothetical protein